jgi:hypothetical protein
VSTTVKRVLRGYEQAGDALVIEVPLVGEIALGVLQDVFGAASEDPMYDAYPVGEAELRALRPYLSDAAVDVGAYAFFLECDAV